MTLSWSHKKVAFLKPQCRTGFTAHYFEDCWKGAILVCGRVVGCVKKSVFSMSLMRTCALSGYRECAAWQCSFWILKGHTSFCYSASYRAPFLGVDYLDANAFKSRFHGT